MDPTRIRPSPYINTMSHSTLKQLPPTLREKKRYLVFEVIAKNKVLPLSKAAKAIALTYASLHGERGAAKAGLIYVGKRSDDELQRGIIRVNRKNVTDLKAAITLVKEIEGEEAITRSIGVSGMMKKAEERFVAS